MKERRVSSRVSNMGIIKGDVDKVISRDNIKYMMERHSLYGESNTNHPYSKVCVNAEDVSHKVLDLYMKDNELWVDIEVLDTPKGLLLHDSLSEAVFSVRGYEIPDGFKLVTVDATV